MKLSDLIKVTELANPLVKVRPQTDPRDHLIQPPHFSDKLTGAHNPDAFQGEYLQCLSTVTWFLVVEMTQALCAVVLTSGRFLNIPTHSNYSGQN